VRRVKRSKPKSAPGQDGLFDVWRTHTAFITSEFEMVALVGPSVPIEPPSRSVRESYLG
jgi:hypothetical protein